MALNYMISNQSKQNKELKIKTNNTSKLIYKATSGDTMSKWQTKKKTKCQIDINNKLSFSMQQEVRRGGVSCTYMYLFINKCCYCHRRQLSNGATQLSNEQLTKTRIDSSLNWQQFSDIYYLATLPQYANNNNNKILRLGIWTLYGIFDVFCVYKNWNNVTERERERE